MREQMGGSLRWPWLLKKVLCHYVRSLPVCIKGAYFENYTYFTPSKLFRMLMLIKFSPCLKLTPVFQHTCIIRLVINRLVGRCKQYTFFMRKKKVMYLAVNFSIPSEYSSALIFLLSFYIDCKNKYPAVN